MGRCFVLRSDAGKAIGYIQQVERTIRYGTQGGIDVKRCQLYFVDQNALVHMSELQNNCVEQVFQEEYVISGGCLIMDDVLIASTSEDAKKHIMRHLAQEPKRRLTVTEENVQEKPEQSVRNEYHQNRNWPPNPCNPEMISRKY